MSHLGPISAREREIAQLFAGADSYDLTITNGAIEVRIAHSNIERTLVHGLKLKRSPSHYVTISESTQPVDQFIALQRIAHAIGEEILVTIAQKRSPNPYLCWLQEIHKFMYYLGTLAERDRK